MTKFYKDDFAYIHDVGFDEAPKKNTLTRQMTIFRKADKLYRRSEETHRLQLYKRSEIAKILHRIGFQVRVVRGYGKLRFRKAHIGFIAHKPLQKTPCRL